MLGCVVDTTEAKDNFELRFMLKNRVPYKETGYFSKLICDYIDKNENVSHLYGNFPDIEGFRKQIIEKGNQFSDNARIMLFETLKGQYKEVNISEETTQNISLLKKSNTYTITTGHQLNVFTGPMYFLYKIVSTINLAKKLKENFPEENFVPVYWMATEDHDFEEINHLFLENKKVAWEVESSGPVGRKSTQTIETVFEEFSSIIGNNKNADKLKSLFKKSYVEQKTLTEATKYLVNELFGETGLVIVDGDDKKLKSLLIPYVKKELLESYAVKSIQETNTFLEKHYRLQVTPREINFFYIEDTVRERIVFEDGLYKVNNTEIAFTKEEILTELNKNPEKFSPNVIMRPLYQEVVLPNLSYIGGGGELAYWLQLKELFNSSNIPFPILMLRNSVLFTTEKLSKKLEKIGAGYPDLFLKQDILCKKTVKDCSTLELSFQDQKNKLKAIFDELKPLIEQTDVTFKGALEAQEKKQMKGIKNLEHRLQRAEQRKHADLVTRIKAIQDALFPRKGLQERNQNFATLYKFYGEEIFSELFENLDPFDFRFYVLEL